MYNNSYLSHRFHLKIRTEVRRCLNKIVVLIFLPISNLDQLDEIAIQGHSKV